MENFGIFHNLIIQTTPDKVFKAVSSPKHLNNWWTKKCTAEQKLGGVYNLYFTDKYNWFGEVVVFEPNTSFSIKMTNADEDWDATSFGFDLEAQENRTLVKFAHTGWQYRNNHFRKTSFCWAMLLNGLKDYLEKGTIVPFNERS